MDRAKKLLLLNCMEATQKAAQASGRGETGEISALAEEVAAAVVVVAAVAAAAVVVVEDNALWN